LKSREERRLENDALRRQIAARLAAEGETDLLAILNRCQKDYPMQCVSCGGQYIGHTKCRRKWCPVCAPGLAADRKRRMRAAVERFKWPLFITLTMRNVDDLNTGAIRQLRRAFGKLRTRKWWRACVKGGVACIEVTNIGNGWHPHLHAVIDARWLSAGPLEPYPDWSRREKVKAFKAAVASVEACWSRILKQPTSSIKVKRCRADTITREVIKYTVKGTDLVSCEGSISQLIHAIDGGRLMTTFGNAYRLGKVKHTRDASVPQFDEVTGEELPAETPCGCHSPEYLPRDVFDAILRRDDQRAHARR
jgi:hypothetical protein